MKTVREWQEMPLFKMSDGAVNGVSQTPEETACLNAWKFVRQGRDITLIRILAAAGFKVGIQPHPKDGTPQFVANKCSRADQGVVVAVIYGPMADGRIHTATFWIVDCRNGNHVDTSNHGREESGPFDEMVAEAIEAMS